MLEVKHISKRFGEHQVLADVSLEVNQGDVVVILGPSGSGKTTFLRCLNHLEKADGGQLTLSDKDYDLAKLSKSVERRPLSFSIIISLPIKQPLKIS